MPPGIHYDKYMESHHLQYLDPTPVMHEKKT